MMGLKGLGVGGEKVGKRGSQRSAALGCYKDLNVCGSSIVPLLGD